MVGCSGGVLPDCCCQPGVSIGPGQRHDRIGDNLGDTIDLQLRPEGRVLDRRRRLSVDLSQITFLPYPHQLSSGTGRVWAAFCWYCISKPLHDSERRYRAKNTPPTASTRPRYQSSFHGRDWAVNRKDNFIHSILPRFQGTSCDPGCPLMTGVTMADSSLRDGSPPEYAQDDAVRARRRNQWFLAGLQGRIRGE